MLLTAAPATSALLVPPATAVTADNGSTRYEESTENELDAIARNRDLGGNLA